MNNEELRMQSACFQWHWNTYPLERRMLHANNNNSENKIKGSINKAIGVVGGVSDMEYITPFGETIYIEMKIEKGVQSKDQKDFQEKLESRGGRYFIIRSVESFQKLIESCHTGTVISN